MGSIRKWLRARRGPESSPADLTTYVGLLRGVNVGPHHRISMPSLRSVVERSGGQRVRSWLASGNVLFDLPVERTEVVEARLERAIERELDLRIPVIVRSASQLVLVLADNPLPGVARSDPARLLVHFLKSAPGSAAWARLGALHTGPEVIRPTPREAYLHYREGVAVSRLNAAYLDRVLGVLGTARNWNTVTALSGLAGPGSPR